MKATWLLPSLSWRPVMIPFYDAESTREADRLIMKNPGMTSSLLMENAGRGAAEVLIREFGKQSWVILCGPGNNGGDGFVLARHLRMAGFEVTVLLSQPRDRFKNEPAAFLHSLENLECPILETPHMDDESISGIFRNSRGIVDALLGTGATGVPRGECERLLFLLPEQGPCKVSLDIPSGVDPSSGEVKSVAFRADLTLTFLALKVGLRVMPGAGYAGKIEVIPIGVPATGFLSTPQMEGYGLEDALCDWPRSRFDEHKGKKGTVLILGGSSRYRGAPLLAARAALRTGAGLVVLIVPECVAKAASVFLPEAITVSASLGNDQALEPTPAIDALLEWEERAGSLVAGPGIGRFDSSVTLVNWISHSWRKPIVLDADALHFLSGRTESPSSLITPHEGEAGVLLGKTGQSVSASRLASVRELARRFGPVLLKGPFSLCCDGNRTGAVLESTPALAIPGSGDILSGITGTLLSKGLTPWKAGLAGAWVHARAGSFLSRNPRSQTGILSREIADTLPLVIGELASLAGQTALQGEIRLSFHEREPHLDA